MLPFRCTYSVIQASRDLRICSPRLAAGVNCKSSEQEVVVETCNNNTDEVEGMCARDL